MIDRLSSQTVRLASLSSTNRSRSSQRTLVKIRIPKNSKLSSFFENNKNGLSIKNSEQGPRLKNNELYFSKSSGKKIESETSRYKASCDKLQSLKRMKCLEKDDSRTRSRLTVFDEYGISKENSQKQMPKEKSKKRGKNKL